MAEVDVRRVERIVRNLLTNAIDHAEGSSVTVRLAADGEATALTVRDHGIGLQPGQSAMVFNRFWRADPARARTTGGTGLGLAIALEDARLHGGWLQAWGTPGAGAQFRLTLPRRAGDPLTHSPLPLVPARRPGERAVTRLLAVLAALISTTGLAAASGCATLPESGPVHRQAADQPDRPQDAPYFNPPGPAKDGSPGGHRLRLPGRHAGQPVEHLGRPLVPHRARPRSVEAQPRHDRLRGVHRRDQVPGGRGPAGRHASPRRAWGMERWGTRAGRRRSTSGWSPWTASGASTTPSTRWSCRPRSSTAASRASTCTSTTRPGACSCPIPSSSRAGSRPPPTWSAASSRVRARSWTRSAAPRCPRGPTSTCPWSSPRAGSPRCRSRATCCALRPASSSRAVDQLAWTLRQVPGIERVRITVGGAPVPLSGGRIDAPVTSGTEFDAAGPADAELWGLRGGRMVDLRNATAAGANGPLSRPGYSMRSLAVSESPQRVAAVSGDGTSLFLAPVEGVASTAVQRPVRGTSLLRPSYDMFGDLWVIDRTAARGPGARRSAATTCARSTCRG